MPALFDHLVGATEDGKWNVQAERPGGLEVDDQLYPRSLLNRQIRRLLAIENPADIDADDAMLISGAGAVVVTSRYFTYPRPGTAHRIKRAAHTDRSKRCRPKITRMTISMDIGEC